MEFNAYEITKDRHLNRIAADSISAQWLTDDVHRWIDLTEFQQDELTEFLEPMELRREILDACLVPQTLPSVIALEKILFISIPMESEKNKLAYLTFLCSPTTLVTIQHSDIIYMDDFDLFYRNDRMLIAANTAGLLFELINESLKMFVPRFFTMRNNVMKVSQALEVDQDEVEVEEIMNLSQEASQMENIFQDQRYCLNELKSVRSESLALTTIQGGLSDLSERFDRVLVTLNRIQDRIGDLHQYHVRTIEEKTNRRLNMLVIVSIIFMPPTLIAAIYGMNFQNIPILGWQYGYTIVMALMVTLVVGLLLFFRSRGWFK